MNNRKFLEYGLGLTKRCSLLNPLSFNLNVKRHFPEAHKRFYKHVTVAGTKKCYEINLDHRKLKTPGGSVLQIPNYPLALAVASEWLSVEEKIIPAWMHLTGLSYTVFDNPQKQTKPTIIENALAYLETDTLLFREDTKDDFVALQLKEWDPVLEWFNQRFKTNLEPSAGICAIHVTEETKEDLRKHFASYNMWAVSGILYGIEAIKSIILTMACLERKITAEKAVQLTLLETEFQAQRWGSVEWAHDIDKYDLLARFSAALLFVHLNSSEYVKKQKSRG